MYTYSEAPIFFPFARFFRHWPKNPEKGLQQGIKLDSAFHCTPRYFYQRTRRANFKMKFCHLYDIEGDDSF
jgi:hypothetical protein